MGFGKRAMLKPPEASLVHLMAFLEWYVAVGKENSSGMRQPSASSEKGSRSASAK